MILIGTHGLWVTGRPPLQLSGKEWTQLRNALNKRVSTNTAEYAYGYGYGLCGDDDASYAWLDATVAAIKEGKRV